ncbi:hypothetical protein [Burkholderia sp. IDO3]|uniref:hypothetical protein n=1 Tax=Burkholderia sp. IDO3 TaxID=1705310 RepID=UPI0011787132|nr:hypothetical protein [Burkholderia sp. IDO3]
MTTLFVVTTKPSENRINRRLQRAAQAASGRSERTNSNGIEAECRKAHEPLLAPAPAAVDATTPA